MGFFSWITQDTNRSIANRHSDKKTFSVTMTDDKGNKWTDSYYDGYGRFDGKDYYVLVAEMNRPEQCNGELDHDRGIGLRLAFPLMAIENVKTGKIFKSQGIDFFNWRDDILVDDMAANDLLETDDWEMIEIRKPGVKFPMLTEDPNVTWEDKGEAERCPDQGYFYGW